MSDTPFGPGHTANYQELVLTAAAGTLYLPLYQGEADARRQKPADLSGQWASGEGNQKDVPRRVSSFARGAGFTRKPAGQTDAVDWDGFATGENICARFGYVIPSGEQTAVAVTAGWGKLVKIVPFSSDLFFIFQNRIAYLAGGVGALVDLHVAYPALTTGDTFTDAEMWYASLRVANVCPHLGVGAGQHHSFVTISLGGAPYTVTQPDETSSTPPPHQFSLLETVFWEYQGVGGFRLVGKNTDTTIRYMIVANGNPYDTLNWSGPVIVGEASTAVEAIVASHDTTWVIKKDGVFSITDKNAAAGGENLTPYWKQDMSDNPGAFYWHDQLLAFRANTIEALDVNSWQVQDAPRPVGISYGRPNDTVLNGTYTTLGSDSGWLLAGLTTLGSDGYVLYGAPRRRESQVSGVTEFDWFPEVGPFVGKRVTAVIVHTPSGTLRPRLWIGLQAVSGGAPSVVWVDLFSGASPLADTSHRYNTTCSITYSDEDWGSRIAAKGALVGAVASRNTDTVTGRKVDIEVVPEAFNPFTGVPSMTIANTGAAGGTAALHAVISRAQVVRSKATLTSTATVPVVLDEWVPRAHLGYPLRRRGTWRVELSDASKGDLPDTTKSTADETLLVVLAQGLEIVTATLPDGETSVVVLDNVLPFRDEARPSSGRRVRIVDIAYTQIS